MKKRLEIIYLRLTGTPPPKLVEEIQKSISEQSGFSSIRIYSHSTITTDLGIHIHIDAETNDKRITELGIRLASELKEYGMVKHTVWFEEIVTEQ